MKVAQTAPNPTPHGEILGIQYLRFLAAFSVVYFHTGVLDPSFAWPKWAPRDFGACGVDLFFVISGFVMMLVTAGGKVGPGQFLLRRIERIAPFYWGATLFAAAVGSIYPRAMIENIVNVPHICLSLAFLPHINPARGTLTPFYGIGWTLNFEMYFYFVFALMLFALKTPGRRVAGLALWCAAGSAIFFTFDPAMPIVRVYTNPMMAEFVAGAAVGWLYGRGVFARMPQGLALALAVAGSAVLLSFPVGDETRIFLQGSAAVATLCGVLGVESRGYIPRWRWALLLGDSTYAIYLVHPMVLSASRVITKVIHLPVEQMSVGAPAVIWMTAVAVLGGVTIHVWIEQPILDWFHRERRARKLRLEGAILGSGTGGG